MLRRAVDFRSRAVARSENPGGHIVLGGDNMPPLVEIGLTDLSESAPPPPPAWGRSAYMLQDPWGQEPNLLDSADSSTYAPARRIFGLAGCAF